MTPLGDDDSANMRSVALEFGLPAGLALPYAPSAVIAMADAGQGVKGATLAVLDGDITVHPTEKKAVRIQLLDANQRPIANTKLSLMNGSGSLNRFGISDRSPTTDADGIATVNISGILGGHADELDARADVGKDTVSTHVKVTIRSVKVTLTPAAIVSVSDPNNKQARLTATVYDQDGKTPVPGVTVEQPVSPDEFDITWPFGHQTDANGQLVFVAKAVKQGTATCRVFVSAGVDIQSNECKVTVNP